MTRPQGTAREGPGAPSAAAVVLAAVMLAAGTLHLVFPRSYEPLIPRALGRPRPWVVGSGLAEIACGALVAAPRTRRSGALATAVLLVAVFPGNVTMAVRALTSPRTSSRRRAVAVARLPLQVPLVLWALRVARQASATGGGDGRTDAPPSVTRRRPRRVRRR